MNSRGSILGSMPPVTKNIILINLIVWLATMVLSSHIDGGLERLLGLHYFGASDFNPVQLLSYMFMHDTHQLAHIVFNMFSLWMFGVTLERTLGSMRFLFYYLSCGIGAALCQEAVWALTWHNTFVPLLSNGMHIDFPQAREILDSPLMHDQVSQWLNAYVTVGASGAVYGVLLAFGMLYPNVPLYLFFIPVPIKAKWMVTGMMVIELLIGLSQAAGRPGDGVAHFAHLGGMIFGAAMLWYWKHRGGTQGPGASGYGGY